MVGEQQESVRQQPSLKLPLIPPYENPEQIVQTLQNRDNQILTAGTPPPPAPARDETELTECFCRAAAAREASSGPRRETCAQSCSRPGARLPRKVCHRRRRIFSLGHSPQGALPTSEPPLSLLELTSSCAPDQQLATRCRRPLCPRRPHPPRFDGSLRDRARDNPSPAVSVWLPPRPRPQPGKERCHSRRPQALQRRRWVRLGEVRQEVVWVHAVVSQGALGLVAEESWLWKRGGSWV